MFFHCSHKKALGNPDCKSRRANGLPWFPHIHKSHHNNKGLFVLSSGQVSCRSSFGCGFLPRSQNFREDSAAGWTSTKHISTVLRESRALYFAKKRVEYLPEASQAALELDGNRAPSPPKPDNRSKPRVD